MGLREKVALAMIISISTQVVRKHCMPRGHSNYPLKSCTKNAKSSELIRFPDVEYPLDYQAEEYYGFLSDYPVQYQPKVCTNTSSPQTKNYGREAKFKRKSDVSTNIKAKPEIATYFTECDSLNHLYCFRRSSFFPEVEYPLSARDTWMPTYWNRLQDVRRHHSNMQKKISPLSSTSQISNYGTDYSNSTLNSLIKTLNTKKDSALTKPISDTFPVSNLSDTSGVFSSDIYPDISIPSKDTISTIKNANHSVINPESIIPTKNVPCDMVTTTTNTEINGPNLYIPREGSPDDLVSKTTTPINSDIPLEPCDSNNKPLDHIVATTNENNYSDLYFLEESIPNNTIPTTRQANNSDISLVPSVLNKDRLDHIVSRTRNPINNNITSELPITYKEGKDNEKFKPEISIFKNDPFVDRGTTTENTKNSDETLFKEDGNPLYNTVSDSSVSNNDPFGDNVIATTNAGTKNDATTGSFFLYEDKGPDDNISSITTSITNCDIKPEKTTLENGLLSDIVATATNTINGDFIHELSITKENKAPLDEIISTSKTATNSDSNSKSTVSENEPFGDIITTTSKPTIGDIHELPILKENDMKLESSIFNNDPPSDILTSTNSDILHEDKALFDIFSIKTSNTSTTKCNIGPEVPQLTESKAPEPTTKSATNSVIQPDSFFSKTVPHEGIRTSTTNTKNSDVIPDGIFKEDKGPSVSNVTIKPETSISNNLLLNAENDYCGYIMLPTVPDYIGNTTQDLATNVFEPVYFMVESNINEGSIPGANDTIGLIFYMDDSNCTLEHEYVDDASVSCTEIPYDFVVSPEYVNDNWTAFANDSYELYQPICDYSDDICLLFIDTNGTIPSGDII